MAEMEKLQEQLAELRAEVASATAERDWVVFLFFFESDDL